MSGPAVHFSRTDSSALGLLDIFPSLALQHSRLLRKQERKPIQGVYLELYVTDKEDTFMRNVDLEENWYKLQIKVSLFATPSHSFSSTSSNTFCNSSTSSIS